MKKKRVFSGVQPTGNLHLGNYLGAIENFVNLQSSNDCVYCVVDLHAITIKYKPEELRLNTLEIIASFLAAGLDYKKNILFNQFLKDNPNSSKLQNKYTLSITFSTKV